MQAQLQCTESRLYSTHVEGVYYYSWDHMAALLSRKLAEKHV